MEVLFLPDVRPHLLDCRYMLILASHLFSFMTFAFLHAKYQDTCFGGGKCRPVRVRIRLVQPIRKSLVLLPSTAQSMCRVLGSLQTCPQQEHQVSWNPDKTVGYSVLLCYVPTILTMKLPACLLCISCRFSSHLVLYQTSSIHTLKTECYITGRGKLQALFKPFLCLHYEKLYPDLVQFTNHTLP